MNGQSRTELSAKHALPRARVSLFGEFQLVWRIPPLTTEALWDGRTSARTLLKLLLCAPGRQAPRGVLTGLLWPESDEEKARESLRAASKVLRKMLQTADGEALLENRNNGDMLKLAEQERLWVDVDAFEDCIAQASRANDPDAALSLWQEAHTLLMRGEFLADDLDAEWSNARWVKGRRHGLWLARCRLMRHLADAYVERGQLTLAEETLEQHLTRYPTNQDALSRLMLLLEQQGCYEQACIMYERARRALDDQGKKPTNQLKMLYERVQQAALPVYPALLTMPGEAGLAAENNGHTASFPIAIPETPRILQDITLIERARPSEGLPSFLPDGQKEEDILAPLQNVLQKMEAMPLISRRLLLKLGIAAFINRLAQLDRKHISATEREELSRALGESISDGWKLFHTAENPYVLSVVQAQLYLLQQTHLLIHPISRSMFYSSAYNLKGLSLYFQGFSQDALDAHISAYIAGLSSGDPWHVVQSLLCQANIYQALEQHSEAIQAMEEALRIIGNRTEEPYIRSRVHLLGCWADNAMIMHDNTLAQEKLDEAAVYLDQIGPDEEFDHTSWLQLYGKFALMTGDYQAAIARLDEALAELPSQWLLRRLLILLPKMEAHTHLRDRNASIEAADSTLTILSRLDAPKMIKPFHDCMEGFLQVFPNDQQVKAYVAEAQHRLLSQQRSTNFERS